MGNQASLQFSCGLNILVYEVSGRSVEVYIMCSLRVPNFHPICTLY